jgi:hypothetical protein
MFLRILGGGIVFILFAVLGTLSVVTLTKTSDVDKRMYVAEKTLKDHEKELKKLHAEILALDKKAKGVPAGAQGDEWAYDGEAGPEKWGARYATCGNGKSQSPLNITGPFEKSSVTLKAEYKPGVLRVINTGRAVMVNVPPGNVLKVGAESYELQQISFHRPSQEQVDGKPMAMGGGQPIPSGWLPSSMLRTSARENQRASSSSFESTTRSSLVASAMHPIISEAGNGQGWEAT